MLDFAVLAPDLELSHGRVLKAQLMNAGLPTPPPLHEWRAVEERRARGMDDEHAAPLTHVLSVGRAALDTWHDFGLIQVGDHRGTTFETRGRTDGRLYHIMVIEHPGTLMQQSFVGHTARDHMRDDLMHWRKVLEHRIVAGDLHGKWCVKCAVKRRSQGHFPIRREAVEWDARVDGVGLCEDHWRRRSQITRVERKPRVHPSTRTGQISGQGEMVPDGQHIMVAKN